MTENHEDRRSELIDRLADLTGQRDRDVLDVTLVGALRDMLSTVSVSIYRCIGDAGEERWLTRARLVGAAPAAESDPAWFELDHLPRVEAHPERLAALREDRIIALPGATHRTLFPVSTDREVVGVLEVETKRRIGTRQKRVVGSVLRIFRNFQGLLDYSERDTLTGLLNRKTFDESFLKATSELPTAPDSEADGRREFMSGSHWLGVIDIDHFKRVNDNYGHLIGDEVLLLLSRLMRGSLRTRDRLYRFGGEEFVALIRCTDADSALFAFERLRSNIEHYAFPQVEQVTVSVGFTEVVAGDTPSGAFDRADKAVYYAKAHGRNQVQHHALLVARGELDVTGPQASDIEMF